MSVPLLLRRLAALTLIGLLLGGVALAQVPASEEPGLVRDSLRIGPGESVRLQPLAVSGTESVTLNGVPVDSSGYRIDLARGLLIFTTPPSDSALVELTYRVLPFDLAPSYARRRFRPIAPDSVFLGDLNALMTDTGPETASGVPAPISLQRSGSISRGIIAGNNRDVTLESGLRLQLAGELAEGVSVQAVLSDENTPIQPDGTTQRLSEFDRVFIQIQAQQGTATLGDYDLRLQGSEFAPFNRKLQGISLAGRIPDPKGSAVGGGGVTVAGATSRGIFRAQQIRPLEGVQGPYRLEGERGEQFIIVIANSERVYVDGQMLTRGETNDYVIDYSTGEITFTSRRIIAEDTRINVEFEYTTNRFTRTLVAGQGQATFFQREDGSPRLSVQSTYIREADAQSFEDELGLSPEDDSLLTLVGDRDVLTTGAERVPFDPEVPFVAYVLRDTAASPEPIFVAATDTTGLTEVYRVRFTRVPAGSGSYRRVGRSVNGVLFEWVGEGRGDYVPGRVLPKPRLQEMVDLTATFEPVKGVELFGEWAGSSLDQNRRSPLDDADNTGQALLGGVRVKPTALRIGDRSLGKVSGEWRRRHTDARFEAFDRTRSVEFGRDWNLDRSFSATGGVDADAGEDVREVSATYALSEQTLVRAGLGKLDLSGFESNRASMYAQVREGNLPQLSYQIESIESSDSLRGESGTWFRQRGTVRQPVLGGKLVPLFEVEQENRQQRGLVSGDLTRGSFSFIEWRPGFEVVLPRATVSTTLERRTEKGIADEVLKNRAGSWTGQTSLSLRPHRTLQTEADIGYRTKRFTETFRINQKERNSESMAVRWTGRFSPWRRALGTNWFYEALTEKTPILQETYVRTGPEIGQYVWEDANQDGIRQIDEFVPERLPNEGVYSRTFVPSDTLEPVINVQARLRLNLEPARLFASDSRSPFRWSRQVTSQTTLEVAEKSKEEVLRRIYLLNLKYFDRDSTTVNGRTRIEQRFDLFRGESRYGGTLLYSQLKTSARRASGRERREMGTMKAEGRMRLSTRVGLRLVASRETSRSASVDAQSGASSGSRTFDITSANVNPEGTFTFSRALQLSAGVAWSRKEDRAPSTGGEARLARVVKLPLELRISSRNRLQVVVRAERADVRLNGTAFGLAAYELTDGRGAGSSYLWNVFAQYRISALVNATFSYDGRAPSDAPVVHTLRMQVSMSF